MGSLRLCWPPPSYSWLLPGCPTEATPAPLVFRESSLKKTQSCQTPPHPTLSQAMFGPLFWYFLFSPVSQALFAPLLSLPRIRLYSHCSLLETLLPALGAVKLSLHWALSPTAVGWRESALHCPWQHVSDAVCCPLTISNRVFSNPHPAHRKSCTPSPCTCVVGGRILSP